ncbi:MAG: opacity protein-like surface antigen [Polaribacter sp.]|jgi:opacity protein-like surface antigen
MDRMDDIWKDRFNSDDLPMESWNNPDDKVWEEIAEETVRKKKFRFAAWLLWGASIVIVSFMAFYALKSTVTNRTSLADQAVSSQISEQKSNTSIYNVPTKNTATKLINNNNNTITPESTPEEYPKRNIVSTSNKKNNTQIVKDKLKNKNTAQVPPLFVKTKSTTIDLVLPITKQDNRSTAEIASILQKQERIRSNRSEITVAPIQAPSIQKEQNFDTTNFEVNSNSFEFSLPVADAGNRNIKKLKSKNNLFINVSMGATYWQHKISQQYTSDLSAADFNYTDELGYLFDIDVNIPLSKKILFQTGAEYEQINISSGHNSELVYNPALEVDETDNSYALDLATPYGLAAAEFRFKRTEELGDDPVDLKVDFHSAHTIRNFSLPLSILYAPLAHKGRFSPYVKVGMGINYLSRISNNIQSIDTHHSAIRYDDTGTSTFKAADIKQWHYDYRLGLGASYQLRNGLHCFVNYEYAGGINSIFKQDDYNTKINRHHLSAGFSKALLKFP